MNSKSSSDSILSSTSASISNISSKSSKSVSINSSSVKVIVYSIITFTFLVSTSNIFVTSTVPDGKPSCVSTKPSKLLVNSSSDDSSDNVSSSIIISMEDSIYTAHDSPSPPQIPHSSITDPPKQSPLQSISLLYSWLVFPPEHTPQSSIIAVPHSPLSFSSSQPTGVLGAQSPAQSISSLFPKHTPQSSRSALKS